MGWGGRTGRGAGGAGGQLDTAAQRRSCIVTNNLVVVQTTRRLIAPQWGRGRETYR